MAYASAEDIADRLGRDLDETESRIIEARLDDAEALLKTRIPNLDQLITDGKLNLRLVVMAEADAMMRLIRNPDGFTQETDGNYSYSIDARVASGRLSFLPEEWAMLGVRSSIVVFRPTIDMPEGMCSPYTCNPNGDFEQGQTPSTDTAVWA